MQPDNLFTIEDLSVYFPSENGNSHALKGISFSMKKGETLGIVGESGSGKSMTALAMMGLLPQKAVLEKGHIHWFGQGGINADLASLRPIDYQAFRRKEVGMIFQEPMTSLNPVFSCGEQVAEALLIACPHGADGGLLAPMGQKVDIKRQVIELFEKVKLPEPERIYKSYPHQLSGGQRQRVMIAMALAGSPSLLIADEPTSALDVTVQRSILQLINELKTTWGGSTIFISHDLGVIAEIADNVLVMQKGEIVERGKVADIFKYPSHPYTQQLLANQRQLSSPSSVKPTGAIGQPILSVSNLKTYFPKAHSFFGKPKTFVKAVDAINFEVYEGETFGIVGESGSGKTTLGRSILKLIRPDSGDVIFEGKNILGQKEGALSEMRKSLQIIFQDPYSSLDPRQPIGLALTEPMQVHELFQNEAECRKRAVELLEMVGLDEGHFWRYPHEFSGGQRQRVCIARALALEPKLIVCDECVSALDVTVQTQILNLLMDLQTKLKLTYLFISHDLNVVRLVSDRIAVMKDGKIVEMGTTDEVFSRPKTAYAKELLEAVPRGFEDLRI